MPSVRAQATLLGMSPTTVSAAYKRLRDRGVVVGKARQGTRVAPRSSRPVRLVLTLPPGSVDALSGSPDPALLPALNAALSGSSSETPLLYGNVLVHPVLAEVAAENFAADGIDAKHLTVTSGAMDAIERVLAAQGYRPGDRIAVEDPGHVPVHQLVRTAGLELVALPMDEEGILPHGLARALEAGVSAVIVTPRAQNPTGAALTVERARELSDLLARFPEVMVIQDDHAGQIAGVDFVGLDTVGPRWATIRSVSKALGPDLRVALVVGDRETIDGVEIALSNGPGWVSRILQSAVAHLLQDKSTDRLVAKAASSYASRRNRLVAALASHGVRATGVSGFNVWIPVSDEQTVVEAARVAGYSIRAADAYRLTSPPAVRVTVSNLDEDQIDELAAALGAAFRARPASPTL